MTDKGGFDAQDAPWIVSLVASLVIGVGGWIQSARNKRLDVQMRTTPSWTEAMQRLDQLEKDVDDERGLRRDAQQAARIARDETHAIKSVFRAFVDRVAKKYPGVQLSASERALLDSEPEYPDVDVTLDARRNSKET